MCLSNHAVRCGIVLSVATLACSSGCKSTGGWKMPSLFASREPDADKIAGRVDTTPTSPASNHTPTAIASKSPTTGTPATPATPPSGLAFGNAAVASNSAMAPTGGLAAQSNGYQTGPYTTNTAASRSTPPGGSTVLSASNSVSGGGSQGFVSPYGGTYTGVETTPTSMPNIAPSSGQLPVPVPVPVNGQLPINGQSPGGFVSNSAALPGAASASNNLPAFGNTSPSTTVPGTFASSGIPAFAGAPNGLQQGASSASSNPTTGLLPGYPSLSGPLPSVTASATLPPSASAVAMPSGTTGVPGASPVASAYQSAAPSGNFAPGTTGRTTNYNFGTPPATSSTLPPSTLPSNTAAGEYLLRR